jgi:uncharacterized coiled-coil protein SlyX
MMPDVMDPMNPGGVQPGQMRASHADRERVATVLNQALAEGRLDIDELQERLDAVYAAKTLAELEPVTKDLPGHAALVPPQPTSVGVPSAAAFPPAGSRVSGGWTSTSAIAVMSGAQRSGDWIVPPRFSALALMGGIELDLTQARYGAGEVVINAVAVMGGIEITVPDDVTVYCDGMGIMGGFESNVNAIPIPGAPVVRVTGFALMGGVEVRRPKRKKKQIAE